VVRCCVTWTFGRHFYGRVTFPPTRSPLPWGQSNIRSRDYLFSGFGHGWHLDRVRFDRLLADAARLRGGSGICGARPVSVIRENANSYRVATEDGQPSERRISSTPAVGVSNWRAS
jgi:flavin-dependent dehydrogenase